ncbi:IgGFc-binding protein-like [Antedon mediterranea]|uniref:IgGFc-binding protein-like n=1 Tax=Antedon mediterranea TaxID=105859 RepID=UPI003AF7E635
MEYRRGKTPTIGLTIRNVYYFVIALGFLAVSDARHFRSATFSWRPIGEIDNDSMQMVEVQYRLGWSRVTNEGGTCTNAVIEAGTLITGRPINCIGEETCPVDLGRTNQVCTDVNIDNAWMSGQGSVIQSFPINDVFTYGVEISAAWPTDIGSEDRFASAVFTMDLSVNANNTINSSPKTAMIALVKLREGCESEIQIPYYDADGDNVQCRRATGVEECGGVCSSLTDATISSDCVLTMTPPSAVNRQFAVTLMLEDFEPGSNVALSKVPLQFIIRPFESTSVDSCDLKPTFVDGTPESGAEYGITSDGTLNLTITARSTATGAVIVEIDTSSPANLFKSDLIADPDDSQVASVTVTYTPTSSSTDAEIFCFTAEDDYGLTSEIRCLTLFTGVSPLGITSLDPASESQFLLDSLEYYNFTVQFDAQIERPGSSIYIRFYNEMNEEFLAIDTSNTDMATFDSDTLEFSVAGSTFTTESFYILFDEGAVVNLLRPFVGIDDPEYWTFTFLNSSSPCASNPCLNGGECSDDGTEFECDCAFYWTGETCETVRPACLVFGQSIQTVKSFDGMDFLLQSPCPVTLLDTNCPWNSTNNTYKVTAVNEIENDEPVYLSSVIIEVFEMTITFYRRNLELSINNISYSTPASPVDGLQIINDGVNLILYTDFSLVVVLSKDGNLIINVDDNERDSGCGLCHGNDTYTSFLDESNCTKEIDISDCDKNTTVCDIISTLDTDCEFQDFFIELCAFEICLANQSMDSHYIVCSTIEAFVLTCNTYSFEVDDWRSATGCDLQCGSNSNYPGSCSDPCLAESCPLSVSTPEFCDLPCIDTCECDENYILSDGECVPEDECGCFYENYYYTESEFLISDCIECVCENDTVTCSQESVCHTNASCVMVDGEPECLCDEGFEGDGQDCLAPDEIAPNITCPNNVTSDNYLFYGEFATVSTDPGVNVATVTWDPPEVFDDRDENVTVTVFPYESGDAIPYTTSKITITFTATDDSGNAASCDLCFFITDVEAPVVQCPDTITEYVLFGESNATINYTVYVSDNVQVSNVNTNYTYISPGGDTYTVDSMMESIFTTGVFPVGKTIVMYTVSDTSTIQPNLGTCYVMFIVLENDPCVPNPCAQSAACEVIDAENYDCICPDGFIGMNCEFVDPCGSLPCENGGMCNLINETSYYCVCAYGFRGETCEEEEAVCTIYGDPHYTTYDGVDYEYQGGCQYVLSQSCNNSMVTYFSVEAKNNKYEENDKVAYTREIYIYFNDQEIAFLQDRDIYLNGFIRQVPIVTPGMTVKIVGLYLVLETVFGLQVSWDGSSNVEIKIPSTYMNCTVGLCGSYDNNPENDFTNQEGMLLNYTYMFGNAWIVNPDECNTMQTIEDEMYDPCNGSNVFSNCYAIKGGIGNCLDFVDGEAFFADCEYDACASGNDKTKVCQSLATYYHACVDRSNVPFDWRDVLCELKCPDGSVYSYCVDEYPETCYDFITGTPGPGPSNQPCREGCQCEDGLLQDGDDCVPWEDCGCVEDNIYYSLGDTYSNENCSLICQCESSGNVTCEPQACHENAVCVLDSGSYQCLCLQGYQGDGLMCTPEVCEGGVQIETITCIGAGCMTGCFESPNYPDSYNRSYDVLYLVSYEGANNLYFRFEPLFEVEEDRDALFVGPGLEPPSLDDLNQGVTYPDQLFDGYSAPNDFVIDGDSAWFLFSADRFYEPRGWRTCWTADDPCSNYPCGLGECIVCEGGAPTCVCPLGIGGDNCDVQQSLCIVTTENVYFTFDEDLFYDMGNCLHVLAQSLNGSDPFFKILINNKLEQNEYYEEEFSREIIIYLDNLKVLMKEDKYMEINYIAVSPPYSSEDVTITLSGATLLLVTSFGLEVRWDGDMVVEIRLPAYILSEGLCRSPDKPSFNSTETPDNFTTTDYPDNYTTTDYPPDYRDYINEYYRTEWLVESDCELRFPNFDPCQNESATEMYQEQCNVLFDFYGPFSECIFVIDPTPYYIGCVSLPCSKSIQEEICNSIALYVYHCQATGVNIDEWRSEDFCYWDCGENAEYTLCGSAHPETCGYLDTDCNRPCLETCECDEGYVLSGLSCVPEEECGCRYGDYYVELYDAFISNSNCSEACYCNETSSEVSCIGIACALTYTCQIQDGVLGCYCPEGTVDFEKECINDPCFYNPCENRGLCTSEGSNYTCSCYQALTGSHCEIELATCFIFNAHYITFDGAYYDFMGGCEYVLFATENIVIVQRNEKSGYNPSVSSLESLAINFEDLVIELHKGRQVLVNQYEVTPPVWEESYSINDNGDYVVFLMNDGLEILYDGISNVVIHVPESYINQTAGLCGYFDNDVNNDIVTNETVGDVIAFGNSWAYSECLFPAVPEMYPCNNEMNDEEEDFNYCDILFTEPFRDCLEIVNPYYFYLGCLYDECAFPDDQVFCRTLDLYTDVCTSIGIKIYSWRTEDFCPLECPDGSHYSSCANCSATCSNRNPDECLKCFEKCECDDGYFLSGDKCVPESECGCSYDDQYIELFSEISISNCEEKCTCEPDGYLNCTVQSCHQNSTCYGENGCVCNDGFFGDGYICTVDPCFPNPCNMGNCVTNEDHDNPSFICQCPGGFSGDYCEIETRYCTAYGDPHYSTFDGFTYDYQGEGYFYLSKNANNSQNAFVVVQNNEKLRTNPAVAYTKEIYIHVYEMEIFFGQGKLLRIDGLDFIPPVSPNEDVEIGLTGEFLYVQTSFGLEVFYNGVDHVDISLPTTFTTEGLCGNSDGDPDNDNRNPEGRLEPNINAFGNSWVLSPGLTFPEEGEPVNPCDDMDIYEKAKEMCSILVSSTGPFSIGNRIISAQSTYESCVYDACATFPDESVLCNDIAGYARLLGIWRIPLDLWRSESFCPANCPENSHYTLCASNCPATCSYPERYSWWCRFFCTEGCECDEGFVRDGPDCVLAEDCGGCDYGGTYIEDESTFVTSNCNETCTCDDGELSCRRFEPCHSNATCSILDGDYACVCNEGLFGDGSFCEPDPCNSMPCMNNGQCDSDGADFVCRCTLGWSGDLCESGSAVCSAWGDPHYTTFDGRSFNYMGECVYTLIDVYGPSYEPRFTIEQKNEKYILNLRAATTKELYIYIYDMEIDFLQEREVRVNGVSVTPPYAPAPGLDIQLIGNNVVLKTNFSLEVSWNGRYDWRVLLSASYANKTSGLCGNYDEDPDNDFTTSDGVLVNSPALFGNSWIANEDCDSLEDPNDDNYDPCEENPQNEARARELCNVIINDQGDAIDTIGQQFIFAFPSQLEVDGTEPKLIITGTSLSSTTVTVFTSNDEYYTSIDIDGKETRVVDLPQDILVCTEVCRNTIRVSADRNIILHAAINQELTLESFLVYPVDSLGTEYVLASYPEHVCTVTAAEDSTITISNRGELLNEFSISEGESLSIQSDEDLTGHRLSSSNPVFVTCGGNCRSIAGGYCRISVESLPPVNTWGWNFTVSSPLPYKLVLVATEDNTTVEIEDSSVTVNDGSFYSEEIDEADAIYISSDKPIMVVQFIEREEDDAAMVVFPPHSQYSGEVSFMPSQLIFQDSLTTVVTVTLPCESRTGIIIDDQLLIDTDSSRDASGMCVQVYEVWPSDGQYRISHRSNDVRFFVMVYSHNVAVTTALPLAYGLLTTYGDIDTSPTSEAPFVACHETVDPTNAYQGCVYDMCATLPDERALCGNIAAYAESCTGSGIEIESWRTEDFCAPDCPEGSQYRIDASGCPKTCSDIGRNTTDVCPNMDVEGCECLPGRYQSGSNCVLPEECGCTWENTYYEAGASFVVEDCSAICTCTSGQFSCEDIFCDANAECVLKDGEFGCNCVDPYTGDGITSCILSPCVLSPCGSNGRCELNENDWRGYVCICFRGWMGDYCDEATVTCSAHGDPHYTTFDGLKYDFQGECRYVFSQSKTGVDPPFSILQENRRLSNSRYSVTEEVYIYVFDKVIEFKQNKMLEIDGIEVTPPFACPGLNIELVGTDLILQTNFSLEVQWNGESNIEVSLSTKFYNSTEGLCGNLDYDKYNEYIKFSGQQTSSVNEFGNSWADSPDCTFEMGISPPDPCEDNEDEEEAETKCNIIIDTEGPFEECHDVVDPNDIYSDCVYDLCATLPDELSLCEDIEAYARQCQDYGIEIEVWRSVSFCPLNCPANSHYEPCMSACQPTCSSINNNNLNLESCDRQCVEGCECNDGYVLSGQQCVESSDCGCQVGSRYIESGVTFTLEDCSETCECRGGMLQCSNFDCSSNAYCGPVDGDYGCICNAGYLGNGLDCQVDPCSPNPCINGGTCTPEETNYICTCPFGSAGDKCQLYTRECSASGDPHYSTFDNRKFDFQGGGEYILLTNNIDNRNVTVVQKNRKGFLNPRVSYTYEIYVYIDDYVISFLPRFCFFFFCGPLKFQVNGVNEQVPYTLVPGVEITKLTNYLKLRTDFGLNVYFNGLSTVYVRVRSDYWFNNTAGLCGTWDGNPDNDFSNPDGQLLDTANAFGNSWLTDPNNVDDLEDPDADDYDPCEENDDYKQQAEDMCDIIRKPDGPFRYCHNVSDYELHFFDCTYDICAVLPEETSPCGDIEEYEAECIANGVEVEPWRTADFCPFDCDEGSSYDRCVSECEPTCTEPDRNPLACDRPCTEGCKCNPGYLLSDGICVSDVDCGCMYEGSYYTVGDMFVDSNCSQSCTCKRGNYVECTAMTCDPDSECGEYDGEFRCFCPDGFIGDGITCDVDPCDQMPCLNNGRCNAVDAVSYTCTCVAGWTGNKCDTRTGYCYAHGDPHYKSFDDVNFDFQGECQYVLAESCNDPDTEFTIVQQNEKRTENSNVAVTKEIYIYANDVIVSLLQDRIVLFDGVQRIPPINTNGITVDVSGLLLVVRTNFSLEVTWNGYHDVDITVPGTFYNKTCGLCGTWDDDRSNDRQLPDKTQASSYADFGNEWKFNPDECSSLEPLVPVDPCRDDEARNMAMETCSVLVKANGPFRDCQEEVNSTAYFDSCVYDVCALQDYSYCGNIEGYAKACTDRFINVGLWRTREICPLMCPEGSEYSTCTACPLTCVDISSDAPLTCTTPCSESCVCIEGFVLSGTTCVPIESCGCQYEGIYYEAYSEFLTDDCLNSCECEGGEVSCEPYSCSPNSTCSSVDGIRQCVCDDGLYGDGLECFPDPCNSWPCNNGGECISDGIGGFTCRCSRGWSGQYCDDGIGYCNAHGDPHYTTFDGSKFDFMGDCEYVLLKDCTYEEPEFLVVQKNVKYTFNPAAATTNELYVYVFEHRIDLLQRKEVRVNGVYENTPIELPGVSVQLSGPYIILETNFSLVVQWDGGYDVDVSISADYFNMTCGLCGNYNGDGSDDFTLPDGTTTNSPAEFGNSWIYNIDECTTIEVDMPHPCNVTTPEILVLAEASCEIIREPTGPFASCYDVVDPESYYNDCLYDACATDVLDITLCSAVKSYATMCQLYEVDISLWRTPDFCPMECPEGSSYSLCANPCPATCSNYYEYEPCNELCVEGCSCDDGLVLSGLECVSPNECGCTYEGRYLRVDDYYVNDWCSEICTCTEGENIICEPYQCHCLASCGVYDGVHGCFCEQPLIGDGLICSVDPCYNKPCRNNGICVPDDDNDDYECFCPFFWSGPTCEIPIGYCTVFGGQHFRTFDKRSFTFRGNCKYTLVESSEDYDEEFSVVLQNDADIFGYPVIETVYVTVYGKQFGLSWTYGLTIDSAPFIPQAELPGVTVRVAGDYLILSTDFSLVVKVNRAFAVEVTLPEMQVTRGLCGSFDGDIDNDFVTPYGEPVDLVTDFGNSWIVNEDECFDTDSMSGSLCMRNSTNLYSGCEVIYDQEGPFADCHRAVPPSSYYDGCMSDQCGLLVTEYSILCGTIQFYESLCLSAGVTVGPWRTVAFCAPVCPLNSIYVTNLSSCPETCASNEDEDCDLPSVPGCECSDGTVLQGWSCIEPSECGCKDSGFLYELDSDFLRIGCNETCTCTDDAEVICLPSNCHPEALCGGYEYEYRCYCPAYLRGDGYVCLSDPCLEMPCYNNGTCIPDSDFTGYSCVCPYGYAGDDCEIGDNICIAYGDPHYVTFDGLNYDFMGGCEYTLVKTCTPLWTDDKQIDFEILQENEILDFNTRVASTKRITFLYGNQTIELYRGPELRVDRLTVSPPYIRDDIEVRSIPGYYLLVSDFGLKIRWDGNFNVEINIPDTFSGLLCGLCGNLDNNTDNEFTSPEGEQLRNATNFGNSWASNYTIECDIEGSYDSESYDPCDESMNTAAADGSCSVLRDSTGALSACRSILDSQPYYDACLYDECAYQPNSGPSCSNIQIYAQRCRELGVDIQEWRNTRCAIECTENSEYTTCASSCPESCHGFITGSDDLACTEFCVEGCACVSGFYRDDDRCVPYSECGCVDDGYYYKLGETKLFDDCQTSCTCEYGNQFVCTNHTCDAIASCEIVDGIRQCVCPPGFTGDASMECYVDTCYSEPCQNDGKCLATVGDYYCICTPDWTGKNCTTVQKICTAYGGLHYTTFDGYIYDFLGNCTYTLFNGYVKNNSELVHISQYNSREENGVTTTESIVIDIDEYNIAFIEDQQVKINGVIITPPTLLADGIYIFFVGTDVVLWTEFGLQVYWDGVNNVEIVASEEVTDITGLCGNFDSDASNDLVKPDGLMAINAIDFGNSWFYGEECDSLENVNAAYEPCDGAGTTEIEFAEFKCEVLTNPNGVFRECHSVVNVTDYFDSCFYDACEAEPDTSTLCDIIAQYAQICKAYFIEIDDDWREQVDCSLSCPDNSMYNPCMSACPPTCADSEPDEICPYACVDGCECQPGYIQDGLNCVPVEQCGCTYDGYYYSLNSSYVTSDCGIECLCLGNNTFDCRSLECNYYAECEVNDGVFGCHCIDDFFGDGEDCTVSACWPNPCPENSECLYRPLSDTGYLCACEGNMMGPYCNITATFTEEFSCYGPECAVGYFLAPNYPDFYPNDFIGFYRLFAPGATSITFTFASNFEVEYTKDALYIGPGVMYTSSVAGSVAVEEEDLYYLSGYGLTGPVIIPGDVAWMYFTSDFSIRFRGFNLSFVAGFEEFEDTYCFFSSETRLDGETWDFGICDQCSCSNGTIACTNNGTSAVECTSDDDCSEDTTCEVVNPDTTCVLPPCEETMMCADSVFTGCGNNNPNCVVLTLIVDIDTLLPGLTTDTLCTALLDVTMDSYPDNNCTTFQCVVGSPVSSRRRRDASQIVIEMYLMARDGESPKEYADTIGSAITHAVEEGLVSYQIEAIETVYPPPAFPLEKLFEESVLRVSTTTVESVRVADIQDFWTTDMILAVSALTVACIILSVLVLFLVRFFRSKKIKSASPNFGESQGIEGVELTSSVTKNEESDAPSLLFARKIQLDDGSGGIDNIYGLKYESNLDNLG